MSALKQYIAESLFASICWQHDSCRNKATRWSEQLPLPLPHSEFVVASILDPCRLQPMFPGRSTALGNGKGHNIVNDGVPVIISREIAVQSVFQVRSGQVRSDVLVLLSSRMCRSAIDVRVELSRAFVKNCSKTTVHLQQFDYTIWHLIMISQSMVVLMLRVLHCSKSNTALNRTRFAAGLFSLQGAESTGCLIPHLAGFRMCRATTSLSRLKSQLLIVFPAVLVILPDILWRNASALITLMAE